MAYYAFKESTMNKKIWRKNGLKISMSDLVCEPTVETDGRRRCWQLVKPFTYMVESPGLVYVISVPETFVTDFATLPLFCQLVLGNRDDWVEAAVLHDWLCETNVPRFIANACMRSTLFVLGCPRWKRVLFFYGLMIFGYKSGLSNIFSWLKRK